MREDEGTRGGVGRAELWQWWEGNRGVVPVVPVGEQ